MVKSLINFATVLSKDNEVDIVLFEKSGELLNSVPKNINIYDCGDVSSFYVGKAVLGGKGKIGFIKNFIKKILICLGVRDLWYKLRYKRMKLSLNKLNHFGPYDVGICFDAQSQFNLEFILNCVDAKVKMGFFHTDANKAYVNKDMLKMFKKLDRLIAVSHSCELTIKKRFPKLQNVDYLYNCQDIDKIKELATVENDFKTDSGTLSFITVSRLGKEKALIRLVTVLKALNKKGFKYNYYIVGDGPEREKVQSYIDKNNLTNVHLLGAKSNPYNYISKCDLFVLPSLYEACPMVYAESMTLGVPVLSTDTCSAHEILDDFGLVCDNSGKGIYHALKDILENPERINELKEKLKDYSFSNDQIVARFYDIVKAFNCNKNA